MIEKFNEKEFIFKNIYSMILQNKKLIITI